MAVEQTLENSLTLLTRPQGQNASLVHLVQARGGQALVFPCMEIRPLPPQQILAQDPAQKLAATDAIIFTSRNAVTGWFNALPSSRPELVRKRVFAVGLATQRALAYQGVLAEIPNDDRHNSEGLLCLELLNSPCPLRVLIARGCEGRPLLMDELQRRGMQVMAVTLYERLLPAASVQQRTELEEHAAKINFVWLTSQTSVRNFFYLITPTTRHALLRSHFVVASERIAGFLRALENPPHLHVAGGASSKALIECITTQVRLK